MDLSTAYLADHPELLPVFEEWFKTEWPEWYGPEGSGDARRDLQQYSARGALPVAIVGFVQKKPVGLVVLKENAGNERPDLSPWVAAGLVHPDHRHHGLGSKLLVGIEAVAREMGYPHLYCGTRDAALLLERSGWIYVEHSEADGRYLAIYRKPLRDADSVSTGLTS